MPETAPPPLYPSLAGWRCRLTVDTQSGTEALAQVLGDAGGGDAASTLSVLLNAGPFPRLRWSRTGQPGDFSLLFAGPESKRFTPVPHPTRRLYADTALGPASEARLELCSGELCILRRESWLLYVQHALTWVMLHEHPLIALHAAVCAVRGVALLVVGPSGCGKSTLAYALARQGADYFSDESAFLGRHNSRLFVQPQRVSLRPGGVAALGAFTDTPDWYESKPNDLKYAPALPPPRAACPQEPSILLFVNGFGDSPLLAPIGGGEAARRLAFVTGYGDPSPLARLEAAADTVSRLPCRALTIGRPDETAALLIAQAQEIACPPR